MLKYFCLKVSRYTSHNNRFFSYSSYLDFNYSVMTRGEAVPLYGSLFPLLLLHKIPFKKPVLNCYVPAITTFRYSCIQIDYYYCSIISPLQYCNAYFDKTTFPPFSSVFKGNLWNWRSLSRQWTVFIFVVLKKNDIRKCGRKRVDIYRIFLSCSCQ